MGDTYVSHTTSTRNQIEVGTEVNTYFDEGLKALAEAQENTAIIYSGLIENLKNEAKKVYAEQSLFKNKIFDAVKLVILVVFIFYILNYYKKKKGKKNG